MVLYHGMKLGVCTYCMLFLGGGEALMGMPVIIISGGGGAAYTSEFSTRHVLCPNGKMCDFFKQ